MPKVQKQLSGTPGTQVSVSDDFDAEAQARLEELVKQAKLSVENRAKADFQQLKTNTEKGMKQLVGKGIHAIRTYTEEHGNIVTSAMKDIVEIEREEKEKSLSREQLFEDGGDQAAYDSFLGIGFEAASQVDQISIGCCNVVIHLDESSHAVPPRMTDGRITIHQLDSGRNRGFSGGNQGDEDVDMMLDGESEDGRQEIEFEVVDRGLQSSSKKKRSAQRG
ncbi:hypothetical protein QFC21_001505 [Naganishia friedmannii]|uniref:Uncharacterized protein n=1 Tax=Naganishia friedmannii TaxID=89922 RepID=A0ACC2W3P4_9TREE|nr:hypothetical protein QFC21_001505 [Naganishia friedmannii]